MKNAEKVESFIRSVFEVYGLDYGDYFSTYTADDEKVELPMVMDGKLDITMVHRAAEILGEDVEDLLSMNSKKAAKWQIRFPYIDQKQSFEYACSRSYYGTNYDTLRLMEVIWDVEYPSKPTRYDYKAVTERMLALLREYDEVAPGAYHEGANIKHLNIRTATFCHFAELEQMMASFFEMVERAGVLFFKALEQDLSAEEIKEYNIIVSILGIHDRCIPQKGELHYNMLRKLALVYKAEQQADFFDYVILNPAKDVAPWRCAEFIQNRDMVQAYANVAPGAKKAMRDFAFLATQFHCSFAWSDTDDGLEPSSIYVLKTADEIGDDAVCADILNQLIGPASKGGITVSARLRENPLDVKKMMSRISALGGNRYE